MQQLIMRWENDKTVSNPLTLPDDIEVKKLSEINNGVEEWLDIIKYMEKEPVEQSVDFYDKLMLSYENYREDLCFIITVNGVSAATITVICDPVKKEGYIHMVACKPDFRGRGIGHLLNDIALNVLKSEKMETAHLTTDDWRIPAIKTYLKAGFTPDTKTFPDFKERWQKIYSAII